MSNKYTLFVQSVGIAINRSATQIASIAITAMLGLLSTEILAEFSLALSFAAILFVLVTTIQMGIQAEFGRRFAEKNFNALWELFSSVMIVVFIVSCFLTGITWFLPNPFSNAASIVLSEKAGEALKILIFSLPLVGLLTTITFFLESLGKILTVARFRIAQIIIQICFVLAVIVGKKLNIGAYDLTTTAVAVAYVLSDVVMLVFGGVLLFLNIKKQREFCFVITKNIFLRLNVFASVLKLGFPVMFGMVGQRFIFYLYADFAASLGIIQTSAFSIANSCVYFFQIPMLGIAHLMTIKISQARGERNSEKLISDFSECGKLLSAETLAIGIFLLLFHQFIFQLFSNDIQVLQFLNSLKWIILLYFLMNVSLTFSMSSLRGHSDTLIPQVILLMLLSVGVFICHFVFLERINLGGMLLVFSLSGFVASYFLVMRMLKLKRGELLNFDTEIKTTML